MYVVAGATGNTGKIVAERLLEKGEKVRAWVRSEEKGAGLAAKGAELAIVDLENGESVAEGLAGAKAAYFLLPPAIAAEDFLAIQAERAERLVAAAERAGLEHVVLLSSIGAQHPDGTGPIRALHDFEQRIEASGIPHTFVRAAYFQENWGGVLPVAAQDGVLPQMLGDASRAIPMVATRDIGETAAKALLDGPQGVIELEGPERYSPADTAGVAAELFDKPVTTVDVPFEAQEAQLQNFGVGASLAALFREMNEGIARGHVDFEGTGTHVRGEQALKATLATLS